MGTTVGLTEAIASVTGWLTDSISMFTSEPLIYFLAIGIVGGVITLFKKGKKAAR